ncbi:MAG: hypothetical protein C0608_03385 [Deltaproteobacteria bacterium]|nr:MAG: hypothetical protein C0608_03385 [Deltaproteobacteria bacterium]
MSDSAIMALEQAIKFESDGRDFYLRAAERVTNPMAKAVFTKLAEDEKSHISRVREIYEELKDNAGWPSEMKMVAAASGVMDVFERETMTLSLSPDASAKEALEEAAKMEREGVAFYRLRANQATCDAEREFFNRLVDEEVDHLAAIEKALK